MDRVMSEGDRTDFDSFEVMPSQPSELLSAELPPSLSQQARQHIASANTNAKVSGAHGIL